MSITVICSILRTIELKEKDEKSIYLLFILLLLFLNILRNYGALKIFIAILAQINQSVCLYFNHTNIKKYPTVLIHSLFMIHS